MTPRKSESIDVSLEQPPTILRMSGCSVHARHKPERYCLDKFWCLNLFQGAGVLEIEGRSYPFASGYAGLTWPGQNLVYRFDKKTVKTWVHFIPHEAAQESRVRIPVMQDLGLEFEHCRAELRQLPSLFRYRPSLALARFWNVLWQLADKPDKTPDPGLPPVVTAAMDAMDTSIASPVDIAVLAASLGISQSHLNRLFKAATGGTVGAYLLGRRMELALHLLHHTTLSVKEVAARVGLPDAQHFNKTVRRHFGRAPTELRQTELRQVAGAGREGLRKRG